VRLVSVSRFTTTTSRRTQRCGLATVVGKQGWIVLTKDDRIRYRKHEREALLHAGARAFVLTNGNLTGDEMAVIFVDALPKIQKLASKERQGFIATVTRTAIRVVAKG